MTTMTIPASDRVFDAAAESPSNAEAWAALRNNAIVLAESGTLLMTDALASDKTSWMDMAGELVKQAETIARVAEARGPRRTREGRRFGVRHL